MANKAIKTPAQVKADFEARGITIVEWAKNNDFPPQLVYQLLNGLAKGRRGQAHDCAIALGLKPAPQPTGQAA